MPHVARVVKTEQLTEEQGQVCTLSSVLLLMLIY